MPLDLVAEGPIPPADLSMSQLDMGMDMAQPCQDSTACHDSTKPVCVSGACVPCARNYQCPGSACDPSGACHDKSKVQTIDDGLLSCPQPGKAGGGAYCTVQDALGDSAVGTTKDVLLFLPSTKGGYTNGGYFVDITKSVRLIGTRKDRNDPPQRLLDPIKIQGGGLTQNIQVSVEDLAVEVSAANSGPVNGIFCGRAPTDKTIALSVLWSKVDRAPMWGVSSQSCSPVVLISDQIVQNGMMSGSGVTMSDGSLTLLNTVIARNGSAMALAGVTLSGMLPTVSFAFNTLADNLCAVDRCNLRCPANFKGSYSIAVGDRSVAPECGLDNSVVPADYAMMAGNQSFLPDFVNPVQGDYHLKVSDSNKRLRVRDDHPVVPYDLDGDPRPAQGGLVDIGADQLP